MDTYSWTMAGDPWIAKEWLSQVVLGAAFDVGGWAMVAVVAALAIATAFGLLARFLSSRLDTSAVVVLLGVALVLSAPHLLARPHVLALPLLVVWVRHLVAAADRAGAPPWWLLGVLVVWANLHGSFLLGITLAVGLGLDGLAASSRESRPALTRRWALFLLLSVLASMVTPYGWGTPSAAIDVLRVGPGLQPIVEWQASSLRSPGVVAVVLVIVLLLLLTSRLRLRWPRALVLVGLVFLALAAVRNGDVLGFAGPIVIATPLAQHLGRRRRDTVATRRWTAGVAVLLGCASILVMVLTLQRDDLQPAPDSSPVAAVEVLQGLDEPRVLNDYTFGGYLIRVGIPTYIDGRTELFGADVVLRHDAAVRADPPATLLELLEEDDIQVTLLRPGSPALAYLDATDEWQRVYADGLAVVHVRAAVRPD